MSVLEKVRKWIDGESAELVLEEAAKNAQVKPRSMSEDFIVKIARGVEEVMQREIVPLPQGTALIPTEYTIFLSEPDNSEWQGVKRKGLEQGLYHILAERAKEIAGKRKLETKTFVVELRVDGTLEVGEVRVQHGWEDSNVAKTSVLARPQMKNAPAAPVQQTPPARQSPPIFAQTARMDVPPAAIQIPPLAADEIDEATRVKVRTDELYKLEVWRGNQRQNVLPISKLEISIGRGSRSKPVDVPLTGDPEISRRHLIIGTDGRGNFWAINEGKNPATVGTYEFPIGQRVTVKIGTAMQICNYVVRLVPV